jgi:hypothetical protein
MPAACAVSMNADGPLRYMSEYDAIATSGVLQFGRALVSRSAANTSASFNCLSSARVYDA